jgi:hypothetical protein
LGPIDVASPWLQQDSVLEKNMAMDNVQKHNIFINVPSSQTFRRTEEGWTVPHTVKE